MSVTSLHQEQEQLLADFRELANTMLAIRDMAATARRQFQSGDLHNGRTVLRRIEEESMDILIRVGRG